MCYAVQNISNASNYVHNACQYRQRNLHPSRQVHSLITFSLVNLELLHLPEISFLFFPLETKIVVDTGRGSISFVNFGLYFIPLVPEPPFVSLVSLLCYMLYSSQSSGTFDDDTISIIVYHKLCIYKAFPQHVFSYVRLNYYFD